MKYSSDDLIDSLDKTLDITQEALKETKQLEHEMQILVVQAKKLEREEQIEKAQKRLQEL